MRRKKERDRVQERKRNRDTKSMRDKDREIFLYKKVKKNYERGRKKNWVLFDGESEIVKDVNTNLSSTVKLVILI